MSVWSPRQAVAGWMLPLAAFGVLLLAPGARGDVVHLRSGDSIRGTALRETPRFWVVLTSSGLQTVAKAAIESVDRAEEAQAAPGPEAAPAGKLPGGNRNLALKLAVTLDGKPLDPADGHTWARIGYFLEHSCKPPFQLLDSGAWEPEKKEAGGRKAAAPASTASHRALLEATSGLEKTVEFYGHKLFSVHRCRLRFRIEKRLAGNQWGVVEELSLVEDERGQEEDRSELARGAYQLALESLVRRLEVLPLFGGGGSGS